MILAPHISGSVRANGGKSVNYNHLMPTRYNLELEGLKGVLSNDTFKENSSREEAKKNVKKAMEERYTSGKNSE